MTAAVPKSRVLAAADPKTLIAIAADPKTLIAITADHECLDAAGPDVSNTDSWDAKIQDTEGPDNNEILINYVLSGIQWNRKNVNIDDIFACNVALEIMDDNEDHEPTSIYECTQRSDWIKRKEAINVELNSLKKRDVFGPIVRTPYDVKPVGYKWVFVRKRNEHGKVVRYKARLVAQ